MSDFLLNLDNNMTASLDVLRKDGKSILNVLSAIKRVVSLFKFIFIKQLPFELAPVSISPNFFQHSVFLFIIRIDFHPYFSDVAIPLLPGDVIQFTL